MVSEAIRTLVARFGAHYGPLCGLHSWWLALEKSNRDDGGRASRGFAVRLEILGAGDDVGLVIWSKGGRGGYRDISVSDAIGRKD